MNSNARTAACLFLFEFDLIRLELAETFAHLPGCRALTAGLLGQHHPHQAEARGKVIEDVGLIGHLAKVLRGGIEIVPQVVRHAKEVASPTLKTDELAPHSLLEQNFGGQPSLGEPAVLDPC